MKHCHRYLKALKHLISHPSL